MANFLVVMAVGAAVAGGAPASQPARDVRVEQVRSKDDPAAFAPDYVTKESWERRAAFLRGQVMTAQGLVPMLPRTALEAQVYGKVDRGEFTVEKVVFQSLPGHYVTGNLYRPKGEGKHPAVLVPYGHWPNGRFMWVSDADIQKQLASGAEKDANAARSPLQASCAMLAKMGCVTFQWDLVGYCDSKGLEHQQGFLDAEAVLRLQSFMGLQTWNSVRALDFVSSLPDVDVTRVACTGASSGGTQTIQLEAIDDRLAATFPVVMVSMNMQGGCVCENAPLLRVGTDNVELASLFAPKPQGMAAAQDWTHDFETRGLPEMKEIYGLYGAAGNVSGKFFPYPHNDNLHSRELMYNFMNEKLKLGLASPVVEKVGEPLKPEELSVWDAEHPVPSDVADAKAVRGWMTRMSDEALAGLEKQPAEYRRVVREALQAMVVDRPASVMDIDGGMEKVGDKDIRKGWIARRNTGERVPVTVLTPGKPTGVCVVWSGDLVRANGKVTAEAQGLVDGGAYVLGVAAYGTEGFASRADAQPATTRKSSNPPYSGYFNGYNRTTMANRVHDLLTGIAFARTLPGVLEVRMVASGEAAPAAVLARALAGDAVTKAAIDLGGFDFDQVKQETEGGFLPGGLKYGGIYGFVPLMEGRATLLTGVRETGKVALAKATAGVVLESESGGAGRLAGFAGK
jgi:dienelactone hydrolase